jgi:uncharacterized protein
MRIDLVKKPHQPTIILGFPGVGLVGPIVTEYLIDHLKTEQIGTFVSDDLPPMVPIHRGALVQPMSVHYSEKYNLVIVYTILDIRKLAWKAADAIAGLANDLSAKEILCLDGANSSEADKIYCFGGQHLVDVGATKMEESVIIGATGALLLRAQNVHCLFAATQMEMPDSKAAASIVQFLDKYLGLQIDPQPLVEQAQQFESKLKSMMQQAQQATELKDKHAMDYLG